MTRSPPAEAEVTAGLGRAVVAARCAEDRRAAESRVRAGRGRVGQFLGLRGRRAEGPGPRGTRRDAGPAPPLPGRGRYPAGSLRQTAGHLGSRRSPSVQIGRAQQALGTRRSQVVGSPRVADVGFLNCVRQAQGFTAPPCHFGNEAKFCKL